MNYNTKAHKVEKFIAVMIKHTQVKYGHIPLIAKELGLTRETVRASQIIYKRRFIKKYLG